MSRSLSYVSLVSGGSKELIWFSTLNSLCRELNCQPGDLIEYIPDDEDGV
ncbi:helix-turn-helix domain-containing protein [bacterium]|nr:helix-turn-helix domain-containing protein [bacterium]